MELVQFFMQNSGVNLDVEKEELHLQEIDYKLIDVISGILEVILQNTIEYNKYSTIEEIHDKMSFLVSPETIEKICDLFCINDGILIKFMNRNKIGYKLNGKFYIVS